jgi:Poly-beta-hydroxybutyrate polymerase N terminal
VLAERDSYVVTAFADVMDRSLHATAARFTSGLSPAALAHAHLDWATHLAFSPGKRLQLIDKAVRRSASRTTLGSLLCTVTRKSLRTLASSRCRRTDDLSAKHGSL